MEKRQSFLRPSIQDIVLLDLKFHNDDDDAVTITRSMLKISPELKILILTA